MPAVFFTDRDQLVAAVHRLVAANVPFEFRPALAAAGADGVAVEAEHGAALLAAQAATETDHRVTFKYDDEEAKGEVAIGPGPYGATLSVDGEPVALIDLFARATAGEGEDPTAQLLLFAPGDDDEPAAKAYVRGGRLAVIVHRDADVERDDPRAIHSDGQDGMFLYPSKKRMKALAAEEAEEAVQTTP